MEPGMVWTHHGQSTTAWDCHWDAEGAASYGASVHCIRIFPGWVGCSHSLISSWWPPCGPPMEPAGFGIPQLGGRGWMRHVKKGEKQMICGSKQLHLCYPRAEKYTLAHGSGKQLRKRANFTQYSQFLGCIAWLHIFTSFGAVSLEAILALRFVLMLSRTRTTQHIIKQTLKEQVTESCLWHSKLARGKVILPCEIILTSIK